MPVRLWQGTWASGWYRLVTDRARAPPGPPPGARGRPRGQESPGPGERQGPLPAGHRPPRIVAPARAPAGLAPLDRATARLRDHALARLRHRTVPGRLTPGKLAGAIGPDYSAHRRAWTAAWLRSDLLELEG